VLTVAMARFSSDDSAVCYVWVYSLDTASLLPVASLANGTNELMITSDPAYEALPFILRSTAVC